MNDSWFSLSSEGLSSKFDRQNLSQRIVYSGLFMLFLMFLLISRLVYLQVIDHSSYASASNENRIHVRPVTPVRGHIFDRNGDLLVDNVASFNLEIIPDQTESVTQLVARINETLPLSEQELGAFQKSLKTKSKFERHLLKANLNLEELAKVAVDRHQLPGAFVNAELQRNYHQAEASAHVLGRVGRITVQDNEVIDAQRYRGLQYIGKSGAERYFEDFLVGYTGSEQVETNAHGRVLRSLSVDPPVSGKNIFMSIDLDLQRVAYESLGDYKGAVVALEPKTGQILAMVSKPSYDPNSLVGESTRSTYSKLLADKSTPLINRAIQGVYSPGSTFKVFLGLTAYDVLGEPPTYNCPGFYQLPGKKRHYRCWKKSGHREVDLHKAIVESCDVYFYRLARALGMDEMHYQLSQYGFGEPTNIGLAAEKSGLLPSRDWKRFDRDESWYDGETLIFGIGQGFTLTTMAQLAHATSIIANKGKRVQPQIILKTEDVNTGEVEYVEPVELETVNLKNPKYYDLVTAAMTDVIHSEKGTARKIAKGMLYTAAGKTGTVQVIKKKQDEEWDADNYEQRFHPHGIFVAFAPVVDPKIVVAIIAENSDSAGNVAVPAARAIMDHYLLSDEQTATVVATKQGAG